MRPLSLSFVQLGSVGGAYLTRKPPQHLLLPPPHLRCAWAASSAASCIVPTSASSQGIVGKGHSLGICKSRKNSFVFCLVGFSAPVKRAVGIVSPLCGCLGLI